MKTKIITGLIGSCFCALAAIAQPDTTTNRIATVQDAAYWHNVNEGDYIFFTGNLDNGHAIYSAGSFPLVNIGLGKKIHIWRGNYKRIFIDGSNCVNTLAVPTIITNLGGQVKWGYSEDANHYRSLELRNFDYLHLTGKYDTLLQTGHQDFKGHNGGADFDTGDYHEKYGLWGNPRWSGIRYNNSVESIVKIWAFEHIKIDYVAATEGGFAGFSLKEDNPAVPGEVSIDVQDCFTAFTESEGFYISYSTSAANQDITKLVHKNNIMAFNGTEALQTDNLIEGSVISNNIAFASASFHRRPFQSLYQDGLHQFSFCEGDITVRDNVMMNGSNMIGIRFKDPGPGRAHPDSTKRISIINNYYGYSRANVSYVWQGDGITHYDLDSNVYGPVSTPGTNDGYNTPGDWPSYFKMCNNTTPIHFSNIIYPEDRPLFEGICGTAIVDSVNLSAQTAPLVEFVNAGFASTMDYRNITFWSDIYMTNDKNGQFIPYEVDDVVFYYDNDGYTRFYTCIQAHSGNHDPNSSAAYWQEMTWNGHRLPPMDFRLVCQSYYDQRKMGLTYSGCNTTNSVAENSKDQGLKLYPNPTHENVTVEIPEAWIQKNTRLELRSLTGQLLHHENITGTPTRVIDMNGLAKGTYLIVVRSDDHTDTRLVVKK